MILKLEKRYFNSDYIQDVIFSRDGSCLITLIAVRAEYTTETIATTVAQEITLVGREAMALKWWLDCNARDLLAGYAMALHEAMERD